MILLALILGLASVSAWTPLVPSQGSYVYDLVLEWGGYGDHDGRFSSPSGIAVDSFGNVYVADTGNSRIQKFTSTGAFITKWGSSGNGDGQFGGRPRGPAGVAVSQDGFVYVTDPRDPYDNRVHKFDSNGVFITQWAVQTYTAYVSSVAVDSSGYVYVLHGYAISKSTSNGTLVTTWGHYGFEEGEFEGVSHIAIDPSGYVYVADNPNLPLKGVVARVQKFTLSGEFVAQWFIPEFRGARDIAVGPTGNVWVGDNTGDLYLVGEFTSDGTFLRRIYVGKLANRQPGHAQVSDIAVDSDANLYLIESSVSSLKGPVLKFGLTLRFPPNAPTTPISAPDFPHVGFSWAFSDPDPVDGQTAWEIQISTGSDGVGTMIWDSNKRYGGSTLSVPAVYYDGSFQFVRGVTYHWRVKTWDNYDLEGPYCADQTFMIGSPATTTTHSSSTATTIVTTTTTHVTQTTTLVTTTATTATTTMVSPTTSLMSTITTITSTQTGTTVTQTSTIIWTTTLATTVSTVVTSATTASIAGLQAQVASNSSVTSLIFDSTRRLLNFTVSGPPGSFGFFDATIARTLLSGQPIVMIDGVEHPASVTQDASFWYIHVTYSHSEHQITIGGSNTIPEFPPIPLLAVIFILAMIILRRRTKYLTTFNS
jgi:hypothetical protein